VQIVLQERAPDDARPVVLLVQDKARFGRINAVRRIWARKGKQPIITVHQRYQWRYLYGFVCPQSGATFWLILPTVSVEVFSQALGELAQFLGVGPDKHLILVLDQAGWHTSDRVEVPECIHLLFQPAYSPEVQPAERLWEVTDEALANKHFDTIDELMHAQEEQCAQIHATRQEDMRSRTLYYWWPLLA
jgi:transposase